MSNDVPPDVGRHDVVRAEQLGDVARADQPRDRAAVVRARRGRLEQVGAAARVVDHEERPAVAALAQLVPRAGELDLHRALQVGVEDRGVRAAVLAEPRDDLGGQDHRQVADVVVAVLLADDPLDRLLVRGVHERPQQRHHERPRAAVDERADLLAHVILVERPDHLAARVDPLLDADDQPARDDRRGLFWSGSARRSSSRVPSIHCAPLPIRVASSWPWVVISATRGPERSSSRFIATVVE